MWSNNGGLIDRVLSSEMLIRNVDNCLLIEKIDKRLMMDVKQ